MSGHINGNKISGVLGVATRLLLTARASLSLKENSVAINLLEPSGI
jgi:hypothetical protein